MGICFAEVVGSVDSGYGVEDDDNDDEDDYFIL